MKSQLSFACSATVDVFCGPDVKEIVPSILHSQISEAKQYCSPKSNDCFEDRRLKRLKSSAK